MAQIKEDRPSYVRFEYRPLEDRAQSLANGHFTTVDVPFAIITPHGTTDEIPRLAKDWFIYLDQSVREERVPIKFVEYYKECYEHWLKGEEAPLKGTPIKDWPPISPAQRTNLAAIRVYTVEDLANANEDTIRLLGMGGRELVKKAENWLRASSEQGKITEEISALQVANKRMESTIERQQKTIEALRKDQEALLEARIKPLPGAEEESVVPTDSSH